MQDPFLVARNRTEPMSWNRIMFAVASSGVAHGVLDKVAHLADTMHAQVELFHCVFNPHIARPGRFGSRGIEQDIRTIVDYRHRQLETTGEQLRARGIKVHTSVRWDDPPHEGIVRQVLRQEPDLLIVQSARRSRAARLVLTQTDYRLIETCPCPVLLLKTPRPYANPCVVAALDPLHAHGKPAALDDAIMLAAGALSRPLGAKLNVYHACEPWSVVARRSTALRQVPEAVRAEVRAAYCEQARARVEQIAWRFEVQRGRVHVEEGEAAKSLPGFARRASADIVAMGAVSRSLPKRAFIGHTAERVLDELECDVLIAKPSGFRTAVSRGSVHRLPKGAAQHARDLV